MQMLEAMPQKGEGIGLKNIQDRLEIRYSSMGLMQVSKKDNRFTVRLTIPQNHD